MHLPEARGRENLEGALSKARDSGKERGKRGTLGAALDVAVVTANTQTASRFPRRVVITSGFCFVFVLGSSTSNARLET